MAFYSLNQLELKVLPFFAFVICSALMVLFAWLFPACSFQGLWRFYVGGVILFLGAALVLLGIQTFRKAKTPKTPNKPEIAKQLVTWGVYAYTRNPMYLGGTIIATGLAFLIGNILAFPFALLFLLYIDRFQIQPEERVLKQKFPEAFAAYRSTTRRWF